MVFNFEVYISSRNEWSSRTLNYLFRIVTHKAPLRSSATCLLRYLHTTHESEIWRDNRTTMKTSKRITGSFSEDERMIKHNKKNRGRMQKTIL